MKIDYPSFSGIGDGDVKRSLYTKRRWAGWHPWIATDPSGMGATYIAANANNQGENGIRLTDTTSGGQNGRISWDLGTQVDFTQDFRMEAVVYLSAYEPTGTTGDGFILFAGASTFEYNVYANGADNGLKLRIFTYTGALDQTLNPAGASIWTHTTKRNQGKLGNAGFLSQWLKYTVDVTWDLAANKRIATAYMETTSNAYAGKWPISSADITSWVPGGGICGFFCSTGGARSDQYLQSIKFEAL